jgi:hypothetical protein
MLEMEAPAAAVVGAGYMKLQLVIEEPVTAESLAAEVAVVTTSMQGMAEMLAVAAGLDMEGAITAKAELA